MTSEVIISMMNSYDPSGDIEGDVNEEQLVEQCVEAHTLEVQEVPVQVPGTETEEDMDIDPVPESTNVETDTVSTSVQPVGTVQDKGLVVVGTDTDIPELIPQGEDDLDLSKRARPDIMMVTSFLCTRVQYAMEEDWKKLERVLGYLLATKEQCMVLCTGGSTQLTAYVDASFALHSDSKSHTGVAIFMGGALLVFAASRKQKCVMKSPTESELVALSDNLGFIELFEEFLAFVENRGKQVPTIYQDSTSAISLVTL